MFLLVIITFLDIIATPSKPRKVLYADVSSLLPLLVCPGLRRDANSRVAPRIWLPFGPGAPKIGRIPEIVSAGGIMLDIESIARFVH